jgi:hypothetical protein
MEKFLISCLRFTIFILAFTLVLGSFITKTEAQSYYGTENIIISEVNFLGSSYSSRDEWIELYNYGETDINLDGYSLLINDSSSYLVSGNISSGQFFLISRLSYIDNNSGLDIESDLIIPNMVLRNSDLNIKLIKNGIIVDEANFAGSFTTNNSFSGRSSFVRGSFDTADPNFHAFYPSQTAKNIKNSVRNQTLCQIDLSTPGTLSISNEQNTLLNISPKYLCLNSEYQQLENDEIKINNYIGEVFNFSSAIDSGLYSIELQMQADFAPIDLLEEVQNDFIAGTFKVRIGDDEYSSNDINSAFLNENNPVISLKNNVKQSININFNTNLNEFQSLVFSNLIIKKENSQKRKNIDFSLSNMDRGIHTQLLSKDEGFQIKSSKQNELSDGLIPIIQNVFVTDGVDKTRGIGHMILMNVEVLNYQQNLDALDPVLEMQIHNPFDNSLKTKVFRVIDFNFSGDTEVFFITIPERHGAEIININSYNKADIIIKSLSYSEVMRGIRNTLNEIPWIDSLILDKTKNINFFRASFKKEKGFIYTLPKNNICQISLYCNIKLDFRFENIESENEDLITIFLGRENKEQSGTDFIHVKSKDLKNNNYEIILQSNPDEKIQLSIYTHGNSEFEFQKPIFVNQNSQNLSLISRKKINWNDLIHLKPVNANGNNLSIYDLIQTNKSQPAGKYNVQFQFEKKSDITSGKKLAKIRAVDNRGNKLFEQLIDENDTKFNELKDYKFDFELKRSSKINIFIIYYGAHEGAKSEIQIGKFNLEKV